MTCALQNQAADRWYACLFYSLRVEPIADSPREERHTGDLQKSQWDHLCVLALCQTRVNSPRRDVIVSSIRREGDHHRLRIVLDSIVCCILLIITTIIILKSVVSRANKSCNISYSHALHQDKRQRVVWLQQSLTNSIGVFSTPHFCVCRRGSHRVDMKEFSVTRIRVWIYYVHYSNL